ncbi:aspartate/glutamate racemase family protein [Cumulibacter soli]|uniref:aspartate/glutamate racemase family protein n=1 Tax=Cumulibacter soli TaxID=2546344 RepID=UPI0010676B57|nr:aspartate/glutamate racemase family protein [Cumulibacter soli]
MTIGFVHTAKAHVDTFDALVHTSSASTRTVHVIAEDLLARARHYGQGSDLLVDVQAAVTQLAELGADVVVCTCSTLGPIAERTSSTVPVVRVDRPMAQAAVSIGTRIAVIAALESTLLPTRVLLTEEAHEAGTSIEIVEIFARNAWREFGSGNMASYAAQIAKEARRVSLTVDVVVLAQASMTEALPLLDDMSTIVLTSPQLAVETAIAWASD